ncbi:MAG: carotenoid 1,2-hydratase [Desulfohalobiaceae bacterium]|nr:carotenoid 1,2-hydratase [Desulfohalobiaceae bacterium]
MPVLLLALLLGLTCPSPLAAEPSRPVIDGPCELSFPRDHGPHPGHGLEWWYYTGNLEAASGRAFGFELTFFRRRLAYADWTNQPDPPSPWRTNQIWAAHFALTDIQGHAFHQHQLLLRGALGLAGAKFQDNTWHFAVKNWTICLGPDRHELKAAVPDLRLDLQLSPVKGPVLHGNGGYSQKGSRPSSASCYVSFPRLQAAGQVDLNGTVFAVRGQAWMDHEFTSSLIEEGLQGWDWFGLQLNRRTEIMLYRLRLKQGGVHPASAGSVIGPEGTVQTLSSTDFTLEVLDFWESPQTGIRYPSGWRLRIRPLDLELRVLPRLDKQEMQTRESSGRTYWEGSVRVRGRRGEKPVSGLGYAELTGYGRALGDAGLE